MDYVVKPSLQLRQLTLLKIVTELWNDEDIRDAIDRFQTVYLVELAEYRDKWVAIEARVRAKGRDLALPEDLKQKVLDMIRPIGLQIKTWWVYQLGQDLSSFPSRLYWTSEGSVDSVRTASVLVKDEAESVDRRLRLACTFCLEDDVRWLWERMPEISKRYGLGNPDGVINFWLHSVAGKLIKLEEEVRRRDGCSPHFYAFHCAVSNGNVVACEHFFLMLDAEEMDLALDPRDLDCDAISPEVACFLLSRMNAHQQEQMLGEHLLWMLQSFLSWPWQPFFMKLAKCESVWECMTDRHYCHLVTYLVERCMDDNGMYKEVFREFWQLSPSHYKICYVEQHRAFMKNVNDLSANKTQSFNLQIMH